MKRLAPFSAVFCVCLLVCFGLIVGHPQRAVAHMDGSHDDDKNHDRDKDHDRDDDHDRGCDQDRDHQRDDDSDKSKSEDRDHRDGDDEHSKGGSRVGSFLTTITNYGTGAVTRSVITLHRDGTMSVIDSGQGAPGSGFSSQLGAWKRGCDGSAAGRTLDFSFPNNIGINRVDYKFDANQPKDTIKGTFTVTKFPLGANPLDGGGTAAGEFEFTGQRIKVP